MKTFIKAALIASVLAVPVASFAQEVDAPVSRSQVRAELLQLEQNGYNPAQSSDAQYPANIQAAEHRIAESNGTAQAGASVADTSGYGASTNGSSQSGAVAPTTPQRSIYFGN
ncbi:MULTISPECIES: DUF4148 domain-containing protein [Paraburkholderia]|uniref:DUF4148 domain-containing protein n=1 Tax=Paraburkholderia TaxID=1822464 RepID=UPI002255DDC6|nr:MULTISPECIES: DUF4148 domain-containing protein [Paraburkholderia]MCX4166088.1 DUF4148 domain-containing protein [Paraburkholderia megapolitana]MDN7161578.1 DUF4148 domain-containing protein [Paraburkholderia sp. CHISQ3]MDQ6498626.1 DUF4148 domain-containing protein [Paraburkholderia megapolitana]